MAYELLTLFELGEKNPTRKSMEMTHLTLVRSSWSKMASWLIIYFSIDIQFKREPVGEDLSYKRTSVIDFMVQLSIS